MGRDGPGYTDDRFRAIFEAALDGMLLTDDERRYVDVNPAACRLLGRRRDELLRLRIEDVSAPSGDLETAWTTFLRAGTMTGEYQLLQPGGSTIEVEFQATANVVPGRHLSVIRDVTSRKQLERDLRELNDQLRQAHDRERSFASTLQEALLPRTRAPEGTDVATRYLPASPGIGVCGDWYSIRELDAGRIGVAVGDVMGHGLQAAGLMGCLSNALAVEMHAQRGPGRALSILDEFVATVADDALATVFHAIVDRCEGVLRYSNAGHVPPLLHDGRSGVCFLDEATAPPLAAPFVDSPRPEATVRLPSDATLVLFSDGLVERRTTDIDEGLERLRAAVRRHAPAPAETLAQALVDELLGDDADDDVALVVIRL